MLIYRLIFLWKGTPREWKVALCYARLIVEGETPNYANSRRNFGLFTAFSLSSPSRFQFPYVPYSEGLSKC